MKEDQKDLWSYSGGENRGWFAAVGGAQIHLAGSSSWSLPLTPIRLVMLLFVICAQQKARRVTFFKRSFYFSLMWWVFWFFGVFYREAYCFGKGVFPCPTPRWGQPPTVESMRLAFALRRAFPVGVLAAGSLWQGVLGLVAQGVAYKGKGHPTLNRTSL